ncbi:hypothetical protein PHMEG_00026150 [Phytophthora megakarya]|uniref:Uncharacterized protein n=1 Tax=Phytophthora megakarya TaxID=4795 RepID=A0A225VCU6_9STRA|nr:hypothetical protein PHMEG_00026150 [Phytophthora megakarya]
MRFEILHHFITTASERKLDRATDASTSPYFLPNELATSQPRVVRSWQQHTTTIPFSLRFDEYKAFAPRPNDLSSCIPHNLFRAYNTLHVNRSEGCTINTVGRAARNGHWEVVRFLLYDRSEGCSGSTMDRAAANGHLKVVQLLHEKPLYYGKMTMFCCCVHQKAPSTTQSSFSIAP